MPDNVQQLNPRRRKPRAARSHEEIYDLVASSNKKAADAVQRTDLMAGVVQRVESKLDDLLKIMGTEHEDERGEKVGTGVVGRLMRVEASVAKRFIQYDGWVKLVVGFTAAVAIFGPVLWWLTSDKLSIVLK